MQTYINDINHLIKNSDILQLKEIWGDQEYDVIEFTEALLKILNVSEQQNVQTTMGIVQIFKTITFYRKINKIKFTDFNQYLIHKTSSAVNFGIYQKQIPHQIKQEARNYVEPPIIIGTKNIQNRRIKEYLICNDNKNHNKKSIKKLQLSENKKILFCLFERSNQILLYDQDFREKQQIISKCQDKNIINIKWCQRQNIIAAMFLNSISFWNKKQNYRYEIKFNLINEIIHFDYIQSINIWIAVEGTSYKFLYINPLKKQPQDQFHLKQFQQEHKKYKQQNSDKYYEKNKLQENYKKYKGFKSIQIKFANLYGLAVNYSVYFFDLKKKTLSSRLKKFNYKIRALAYSNDYQLLFLITFDRIVQIFQLNPKYSDFQKKQSKIISKNIFVNIVHQPNSPNLITYDEGGHLRLWNIIDMVCFQTIFMGIQFSNDAFLCTQNKLIIGNSRVTYYQFIEQQIKSVDTITSLAFSNQIIYVGISKFIKCINILTGKTEKIFEGVLDDEQISQLIINQRLNTILVIGNKGCIVLLSMDNGQQLNKILMSKQQLKVILDVDSNNFYITTKSKLNVCKLTQNIFSVIRQIEKVNIKIICSNFFSHFIGILTEQHFYIISQDELIINHIIKIQNQYNLIGIKFIIGTQFILMVYKKQIILVRCENFGKVNQKYKAQYTFSKNQYITSFLFENQINQNDKLLKNLIIYCATNQGNFYKFYLRNINIEIIKSRIRQQEGESYNGQKKALTNIFEAMKLNYLNNVVKISEIKFNFVRTQVLKIKTKLKFIKNIEMKVNENLKMLAIFNVNMILIYNQKIQQIGQIKTTQTYPIYWNISNKIIIQKQKNYAKKVLNYLGKTQIDSDKVKIKDYIINSSLKKQKNISQNIFLKKLNQQMIVVESSLKNNVSKILKNKQERLQKLRSLKKRNIYKQQEDQTSDSNFGITSQYIKSFAPVKSSHKIKTQTIPMTQRVIQNLKTEGLFENQYSLITKMKTLDSQYSPVKLTQSQSKYEVSKINNKIRKQLAISDTKFLNERKNRYISFGGKMISANNFNLPKINSNRK